MSSCSAWNAVVELLDAERGIGRLSAISLTAVIPELGTLNRKQIAKLVGVAPLSRDSGMYRGATLSLGRTAPPHVAASTWLHWSRRDITPESGRSIRGYSPLESPRCWRSPPRCGSSSPSSTPSSAIIALPPLHNKTVAPRSRGARANSCGGSRARDLSSVSCYGTTASKAEAGTIFRSLMASGQLALSSLWKKNVLELPPLSARIRPCFLKARRNVWTIGSKPLMS